MIAQGFGFTRDYLKERNNSTYCRLKKIPCGCKEQARARHPGEKCGLAGVLAKTRMPGYDELTDAGSRVASSIIQFATLLLACLPLVRGGCRK
jgi:hypothetical protein